jgi:hypothetical protein
LGIRAWVSLLDARDSWLIPQISESFWLYEREYLMETRVLSTCRDQVDAGHSFQEGMIETMAYLGNSRYVLLVCLFPETTYQVWIGEEFPNQEWRYWKPEI